MKTNNWTGHTHFAGLDWGRYEHELAVVDSRGSIVESLHFAHNAAGWQKLRELLAAHPGLPVAVETSQGRVVDLLLECGALVYPINPKAAKNYRERLAPSGVKDDARDAWALADALRVDGHGWRALTPTDALLKELRLLCADEVALIEQRSALIAQLRQALFEYYPAALEAFADWTLPAAWAFVVAFPTPERLQQAGRRRWEKFLHTHRLWRSDSADTRLAIFARACEFAGDAATTSAKSLLAVTLAVQLRELEARLQQYRERIGEVFAQHPDHDLFGSLPGAGQKLAPRLLAELGDDRAHFATAAHLQAQAGTAPCTIKSGRMCFRKVRYTCDHPMRATVHLWADHSRKQCAWAQAYYKAHRAKGQSHAMALRCLGQRWLKILWKMWQTHTPYDEALHTQNQVQHGSWILQLLPQTGE